jgi:hypothetical protein
MHVVEALEDLLRDLLDEVFWDALALMPLDEAEQVFAEDLKDHAYVGAVGALVAKVVEEGDDMGSAWVGLGGRWGRVRGVGCGIYGRGGGCDETLEELDLVQRRFCVARGGLDDLEGDVPV